ncbi:MAG: sensor histidine kinase [Burkholderiales bacterium]
MQGFGFALLAVAAFNTGIAVLLTLVGYGGRFAVNLVFSQCIGLLVFALIHGGWRLLWPGRRPPLAPFAALAAGAVLAGWLAGSAIASALLGMPQDSAGGTRAALAVTVAAGLVGTWFFWTRQRAAELERRELEARLKLLQAQIEPHFLFNTLANLDALIQTDPPRARAMLAHLNRYLRGALGATRAERSTLGDEFALLRGYLEVQAVRMGARLRHALELPDALAGAAIPPMLLQPLVENAIRHGIEPKVEGGELRVHAREAAGGIEITVADTGLGESATAGSGVGLANVRARTAAANGTFDYVRNASGGVTVTLRLPR